MHINECIVNVTSRHLFHKLSNKFYYRSIEFHYTFVKLSLFVAPQLISSKLKLCPKPLTFKILKIVSRSLHGKLNGGFLIFVLCGSKANAPSRKSIHPHPKNDRLWPFNILCTINEAYNYAGHSTFERSMTERPLTIDSPELNFTE